MKSIFFVTPKAISEMDITTIGGSGKRNDETKIGQFCSGLKYALALFLRNDIECNISSTIGDVCTNYSFVKTEIIDKLTNKEKSVIGINIAEVYLPNRSVVETHLTSAFAFDLGYDWKLEFGLREIWSNMVDEGGFYCENLADTVIDSSEKTIIELTFDEDSDFNRIWENRNTLFITDNETPLYVFNYYTKTVKVYRNTDDKVGRIYKQGILIHEETEYPSYSKLKQKNNFRFSTNFGELDERRVICDSNTLIHDVFYTIVNSNNQEDSIKFLFQEGCQDDFSLIRNTYSNALSPSKDMVKYLMEYPDAPIPSFLRDNIEKLENTPLGNRRISTLNSSIYDLKKEVKVEETTKEIKEKSANETLTDLIQKRIPFKIGFPVKEAFIKGSNVVSDNYNKTILVTETFDPNNDDDIIDFIIQHFNLVEGSENTFRKIIKLLIK